jgi:hypothetical protein
MAQRSAILGYVIGLVAFSSAAAGEADRGPDARPLPELLQLEPIKEDRPEIDSTLSEVFRLQRARYNVALEDVQTKSKLFPAGRCDHRLLLESFKRLRRAEFDLPGRARDGFPAVAASRKWLEKELEFLSWMESVMQKKFNSDVVPRHELLEVQYYLLEAKEKQATYAWDDARSAAK